MMGRPISSRTIRRRVARAVHHDLLYISQKGEENLEGVSVSNNNSDEVVQFNSDEVPCSLTENLCDTSNDTVKLQEDEASSCSLSNNVCDSDTKSITNEKAGFGKIIGNWSLKHNIPRNALSNLLRILKPKYPDLPRDARSLLRTPRTVAVKELSCGGKYFHWGILQGLSRKMLAGFKMQHCSRLTCCLKEMYGANLITLSVNIDGLPLTKSTNYSFWTILGKVDYCNDREPFLIGVFWGKKKTGNVAEFLSSFTEEVKLLEQQGLHFGEGHFHFRIGAIICDAPARSMIKCVKPHNGYYGCEHCVQRGEWCNKVVFPELHSRLRKNEHFIQVEVGGIERHHHTDRSPLTDIELNFVDQIPLDYMHLICLGVMKRFLLAWIRGPLVSRLPARRVGDLSTCLLSIAGWVPREFSRKPRDISEVDRWKATEFRFFLLYAGPVILNNLLSIDLYNHFLIFHAAVYILASDTASIAWIDLSEKLLHRFVSDAQSLYGKDMLVYNVHSLIHVPKQVKLLGPLDTHSSFPFENYMKKLKRMLRTNNNHIAQIAKRLHELANCDEILANPPGRHVGYLYPKQQHQSGPILNNMHSATQYEILVVTDNFTVGIAHPDNCFVTHDNTVIIVKNIVSIEPGSFVLICGVFGKIEDLYTYPFHSSELGVCVVSDFKVEPLVAVECSQVNKKCVMLPMGRSDKFAVLPYVSKASYY